MPKNVNQKHQESLSNLEKLALIVTNKVGTMGFFFLIFGWTVLWLGWNIVAPNDLKFDPFPAFVLWLFISNLIQIHLMPLIMIGQNLQSRHAELRAETDFDTDTKSAEKIDKILEKLTKIESELSELRLKSGKGN